MNNTTNFSQNGKKPKFLVDFMLGRLAKWLRIFGYDTLYADRSFPDSILLTSLKDNRILITRNTRLSRNRALKLVLVESDDFLEQVAQVTGELKLTLSKNDFFSRCTSCNTELSAVKDKVEVKGRVPEYVFSNQDKFTLCPNCGRIYWAGTHYDMLLNQLKKSGLLK